jgi:hypothetical protein
MPPSPEQRKQSSNDRRRDNKAKAFQRYVATRVLKDNNAESEEAIDPVEIRESFTDLSTREKADLLYEKLMAYVGTGRVLPSRETTQEDGTTDSHQATDGPKEGGILPGGAQAWFVDNQRIDPYLRAEIKTLWEDQDTRELVLRIYPEVRLATQHFRRSELGARYHELSDQVRAIEQQFQDLSQQLFLGKLSRPDQISSTRSWVGRLAKQLTQKREALRRIASLHHPDTNEPIPPTPEVTAIAAQIMYERLKEYHRQATEEGFVWIPSRVDIHHKTMAALQNGRWPVLVGEAGTGKSFQADAAARALTGSDPTHLACSSRTNETHIIADVAMQGDESYEEYKPPMQAFTGYTDSRNNQPAVPHGRIVRFDESGRLGDQGYAVIKELRQKKPGDLLHGKPVLPGAGAIWATNPVGPRYPDRRDPDPAMRRELSFIDVPYPDMDTDNPELYEFMTSQLFSQSGAVHVAETELTPAYTTVDIPEAEQTPLPDGRIPIQTQELIKDPTDNRHGTLYRLAFAIKAIEDAFVYGNTIDIPNDALRFITASDGTLQVTTTAGAGELLTLSTSTVTLGEIASWMHGFADRTLKDDASFHTQTLTEWIQKKLTIYLEQVDSADRAKLQAIMDLFHLFDPAPDVFSATPMTPERIGFLSPRVPRPLILKDPKPTAVEDSADRDAPEPEPTEPLQEYIDMEVMLTDGSTVKIQPAQWTFEHTAADETRTIDMCPSICFTIDEQQFVFAGELVDAEESREDKYVVKLPSQRADEALYKTMTREQIEAGTEFSVSVRLAHELMDIPERAEAGKRVFGPEEISKTFGVEILQLETPVIPFSQAELEQAKALNQMLILRIENGPDGNPMTMEQMETMFKDRWQQDGKGAVLNHNWDYTAEDFFKDPDQKPTLEWALVTREVIPASTEKNYVAQTEAMITYLRENIFGLQAGEELPSPYQEAIKEFERQKRVLATQAASSTQSDWQAAADTLAKLQITKLLRRTSAQVVYDLALVHDNTNERLLPNVYDWTRSQGSDRGLVGLGKFKSHGLNVFSLNPGRAYDAIGVVVSRSH